MIIDGLQYCNWSEAIFRQMRAAGVTAVHATICYHETLRETIAEIERWNRRFERHADLIFHGR
ncbi:MAG TPA: membrane dipeptidase, partial [Verrucomicrobiae bacterium]|nr:membrane dipeptidase [Verrucomicrobiae bacterium]